MFLTSRSCSMRGEVRNTATQRSRASTLVGAGFRFPKGAHRPDGRAAQCAASVRPLRGQSMGRERNPQGQ